MPELSEGLSWSMVGKAGRWSSTQARWVLGELKRSGLGIAAFSRRHEVDRQRVYYWLKRLERQRPEPVLVEVTMPGLTLSKAPESRERIEIELTSGRRLVVAESVNVHALRRIADALEAEC